MNDEIKEIYLSNLEWTKTHDNMGGVMGNIVFKNNISYEEYQKLFKSGYFVLCDKDYIINLQNENEHLRTQVNTYENPDDYTLFYMWLDAKAKDKMKQLQEEKEDYKSRYEKAIDKMSKLKPFIPNEIPSWLDELENILNGGDE